MKKFLGLILGLSVFTTSFAVGSSVAPASSNPAKINAGEFFIPIGKDGQKISLLDLSQMKVKEFEALTDRKMKFVDKIKFRLGQKQLAKSINADGTISTKKLTSLNQSPQATEKSRKYLRLWLILLGVAIVISILGVFVPFLWIIGSLAGLASLVFFVLWIIEMSK